MCRVNLTSVDKRTLPGVCNCSENQGRGPRGPLRLVQHTQARPGEGKPIPSGSRINQIKALISVNDNSFSSNYPGKLRYGTFLIAFNCFSKRFFNRTRLSFLQKNERQLEVSICQCDGRVLFKVKATPEPVLQTYL